MSAWEAQVLQTISGIGEAYRQPLLDIINAYVKSIEIGKPLRQNPEPLSEISEKKKALLRMEQLRTEFTFPSDFDIDKELEEARSIKYGGIS